MKVMHLELGRYLYGGARQVAYLLDGLGAFPGEHVLVCAQGSEIATALHNPRVKVIELPFSGDADFGFLNRVRQAIRAERPSLLHAHSRRGDMLCALAAKLEHCPAIHSRRVDNPPRWLDLSFKFPLFRKIVTISEGIREVLKQAGVAEERLVCIPSEVDTQKFQPVCHRDWFIEEFGLKPDEPVMAVIAQLIERKGHAVLFEALPAIFAAHPAAQWLIFGQGPLQATLRQQIAERGFAERVRFAGFRADLDRKIGRASCRERVS
jgi:glycosyltransferase involved in cell wall biosynthesis